MWLLTFHCFVLTLITVFSYVQYHISLSVSTIFSFVFLFPFPTGQKIFSYLMLSHHILTLIWVGFLGVRFEVVGGEVKLSPSLKLVRIILEASNLARKYTSICSFGKYIFQCLGPFNFADVSILQQRNIVFSRKRYLYSKQQCESCVKDFLVLFSVFVRQKISITENLTFADSVSRIRPLNYSKLAKNPKNDNDVTIFRHDVIVKIFDVVLFLLSSQLLVQASCQYHH